MPAWSYDFTLPTSMTTPCSTFTDTSEPRMASSAIRAAPTRAAMSVSEITSGAGAGRTGATGAGEGASAAGGVTETLRARFSDAGAVTRSWGRWHPARAAQARAAQAM